MTWGQWPQPWTAQLYLEDPVRRARAADFELFGNPQLLVTPSHKRVSQALTKGGQPLLVLTAWDMAVALTDVTTQEPASPA